MNNFNYSNTITINFIIVLILPFLILGPFFPDLIVSTSCIFFLLYTLKNKKFYYFKNIPFFLFLFFCIISIVSSLLSEDISLSIKASLFYFRIGLFSCLVWYLIDKDKSILTYTYYALLTCFSILVIDGYFQYFVGVNLVGLKSNRISSFFGDELILGSYLSRLFPLLFGLFLIKKKQKFEIYFIGILFILVDVLIYISGERAAFFFLNLSTIFIIVLIKDYQKFRLVTFIFSIIAIIVVSYNTTNLSDRMFKDPARNMGIIKSLNKPTIFTPAHDSLIRTAYNMFKEKPIIGHGPKMFRVKCKEEKYVEGKTPCSTHPHNFYVQLLAETGILGFLILFIALCYVFYTSSRQLKSIILKQKRVLNDFQVCLLAGILITVWPITPNGNFFNNWMIIVYSFPVGFYLQSIYSKKSRKKI